MTPVVNFARDLQSGRFLGSKHALDENGQNGAIARHAAYVTRQRDDFPEKNATFFARNYNFRFVHHRGEEKEEGKK